SDRKAALLRKQIPLAGSRTGRRCAFFGIEIIQSRFPKPQFPQGVDRAPILSFPMLAKPEAALRQVAATNVADTLFHVSSPIGILLGEPAKKDCTHAPWKA